MVLERNPNNSGWVQVSGTLPSITTSFNCTGLAPSTTSYFRIHATSVGGNSPFNTAVAATSGGSSPSYPTPTVVSLGQDGHDMARLQPTGGSDNFQDVHLVLTGLSASVKIDHVALSRDGGRGEYLANGSYGS